MTGYVVRQFICPKAVTRPTTNRAQCRATALIKTNALPLHQTTKKSKGRYGSFQLWIERVGVQVKLWDPLRTRVIPERFWGDDSRRGTISSVRTFTFLKTLLHVNWDFTSAQEQFWPDALPITTKNLTWETLGFELRFIGCKLGTLTIEPRLLNDTRHWE